MSEKFVPGAVIDGFSLGERLHSGAMGDIFRVTHPRRALPMLMKVPRFRAGDSAENLLSFETEVMILPELKGGQVPRFVAAGDLLRAPYVVMEFIEGESLENLRQRGRLPVEELARIGAGIADALHDIHRQGVIHLDLKPDNVLVRPDGRVALIDFGLSHHARFPDLLAEEKRCAAGSAPTFRPSRSRAAAPIRAAIFSHWAWCFTNWPRVSCLLGSPPPRRACGIDFGWIPNRRGPAMRPFRRGCRKSSCGVSRSTRTRATRRLRTSRSTCGIPRRCR